MKKISLILLGCLVGVLHAHAVSRTSDNTTVRAAALTTARGGISNATVTRSTGATSGRSTTARNATTPTTTARSAASTITTTNRGTSARSASTPTTAVARTNATAVTSRAATSRAAATIARSASSSMARARSATAATTNTFDAGYNACRDAYFTCMDQFCAQQNESYRRCVCSSRLDDIKSQERVLGQTAEQLQDFKDLNIAVITKSAAEVQAMLSASEREAAAELADDKSQSAGLLAGISDVLNKAKKQSLSTQGTLDIAGDINAIWSNTDLAAGANLATLTGEALYNAVHSQCAELIRPTCGSTATFNMVVSAYGMTIENDCTTLANALSKQTNQASGDVRKSEREMNLARLENYNTHNSSSINDCIASVRTDITNNMACGPDYVHCLDISGQYLNRDTGEPIYTTDFYMLESQISLSGDVLTNEENVLLVAELNRKKSFAQKSLDSCRDLSDDVWEEFMRQAIAEIYQGQQQRIRQVKNECMDVVNKCYDEQNKQLKDFSNIKEQLLLGSRLELSEEMCKEKLDACSNLYGGGPGGLDLLLNTMHGITDQKIAKECQSILMDFAKDMCSPPASDTQHGYPYGCRTYLPGNAQYATDGVCNMKLDSTSDESTKTVTKTPAKVSPVSALFAATPQSTSPYVCPTVSKIYTSCNPGYYLWYAGYKYNQKPASGLKTVCLSCPENKYCAGGTAEPSDADDLMYNPKCEDNGEYVGSLYQKLVRYSLQTCIRPSATESGQYVPPNVILQDVNIVMDSIRVDMAKQLSAECDRRGGIWVSTPHDGKATLADYFYKQTGSNTAWGYCAEKDDSASTTP